MRLLDSLIVISNGSEHTIELYHGDLTNMPPTHAVDVLVVSAFPNDYSATPSSLIGALDRKGISIRQLAHKKQADLRDFYSCWLSYPIHSKDSGIQFKQVLCFEPLYRGHPTEVVSDIFQSLMPFVNGTPHIKCIAMPVVATGEQRVPMARILEPLLDAAVNWLALGLPVKTIKIVEFSESKATELKGAFAVLKNRYINYKPSKNRKFSYDFFISYSHQNLAEIEFIYNYLKQLNPNLQIFLDRKELNVGASWQQELYEALDDCHKVLAVYSPLYLLSKVCKEEYHIALLRHRDSDQPVLIPMYLYTCNLPSYMQLIQFIDCREGNKNKIRNACETILKMDWL